MTDRATDPASQGDVRLALKRDEERAGREMCEN